MYFIVIERSEFSGLSRNRFTNKLSVLLVNQSLYFVLRSKLQQITDGSPSSKAYLSSEGCKTDKGEVNHCH